MTYMRTVGIRELQQHASAVLRHVRNGERVAVTDRGTVVAVIAPPGPAGGAASLIAAGRVNLATSSLADVRPVEATTGLSSEEVLDDLRADRV
jgi:prevent-host-death family protein